MANGGRHTARARPRHTPAPGATHDGTSSACVAENPVSKLASVQPARQPQFPILTVSLDAQESTLHQENFLLQRQVGPSVLGIVIAVGRRASDISLKLARPEKKLKIFASAQSASFCIQEIPSDAAISEERLHVASRSRIVENQNEHSLCVFIGRYWC